MNKKEHSDLSGWKNLKKLLNQLDKTQIETGFFPESKYGDDNDNLQIAQVAAWQEFGTPFEVGSHIPPRDFMRGDFKFKMSSRKTRYKIIEATNNVLRGTALKLAMEQLRKHCQDMMMDAIDERAEPRNKDSTIAKKGFNDPLNETGVMLESVKAKITRG